MRLKKSILEILLTLSIISITTFTYALLADLKVTSWDTLTATNWNAMIDHSVPTWAVMAFDLETCPTGWSEYTALQWKFIRWADTWANNDPDFTTRIWWTGARKIWSTQSDAFKSHNVNQQYVVNPTWTSCSTTWLPYSCRSWYSSTITLASVGWWSETRPTNVYLLYCKKD